MDRERLSKWLTSPHRTWRWNDGEDHENYEGVATHDGGLRWFRWTHVFDSQHGEHDVVEQTFDAFVADGPPRPAPEEVSDAVRAWVEEHATGYSGSES